jgi:hypothetical protein
MKGRPVTTGTRNGLCQAEQDHYQAFGFVTIDELLPWDSFYALKDHFERKLAVLAEGERPEDMDVPHFTDPALFRWLFDSNVLDVVESILGPDLALFSSHFFCKPPADGKSVPWHQDAYFWRNQIKPASEAVTVWLAIDPATEKNGCMRVIPASHRERTLRYQQLDDDQSVFDEELDPADVDERRAIPVELQPNQASIHSAALVHGSPANTSPLRRCGFTMRYISTRVRFNYEEVGDRHQIYLARGVDRSGNVYADPTKAHEAITERRAGRRSFVGPIDRADAAVDLDGITSVSV